MKRKSEYALRFRSADQHGQLSEHRMVFSIVDLNENPQVFSPLLRLSMKICVLVTQSPPYRPLIPILSTPFTYKFAVGSGSQHNSLFSIDGDQLILDQPLVSNDQIPEYFIRLQSLDKEGAYTFQSFSYPC